MDWLTFANEQDAISNRLYNELRSAVERALGVRPRDGWEAIVLRRVVSVAREFYRERTERASSDRLRAALSTLSAEVGEMLAKTTDQENEAAQVNLITRILAQSVTNYITEVAVTEEGGEHDKVWLSMEDAKVRPSHAAAHGQRVKVGEKFTVGGHKMSRPGDVTAPISEWANCRCVEFVLPRADNIAASLASWSASDRGGTMPDTDTIEPEIDEQELDEALAEVEEVPWHGVLTREGVLTVDGRKFGVESMRWDNLPAPLMWQKQSGEGHNNSVVVGRIDKIWRDGDLIKAAGVFADTTEAEEVIALVAESFLRGVSVDVNDARMEMQSKDGGTTYAEGDEMDDDAVAVITDGRILGATVVPMAAFYDDAFISLGRWPEEEAEDIEAADEEDIIEAQTASAEVFISEEPWDGSASNYDNEQWYRATLIHLSDDVEKKSDHKLPIYTPSGELSRAGVHAAAARVDQVDAPAEEIASAKRQLRVAYEELDEEPPESLTAALTGEFAPGTQDGPGWITHPRETNRLRNYWVRGKGALKIAWGIPGDFRRCRVAVAKYIKPQHLNGYCANRHKDALGFWPGEHHSALGLVASVEPGEMMHLVAATAPKTPPREWFENPQFTGPAPITVTKDGRIFGHVATWGTCHVGFDGVCIEPPSSKTNYAHFMVHSVETDDGEIPCGYITMNTGHADQYATAAAAAAHYDNTATVAAKVAAGEDEWGIWIAGATKSSLSEDDIDILRGAALSGDWRSVGGNLEMVAALCVNTPGFPIPRVSLAASGGKQMSLVAAGVVAQPKTEQDKRTIEEIVAAVLDERERQEAERAEFARMREQWTSQGAEEFAEMRREFYRAELDAIQEG